MGKMAYKWLLLTTLQARVCLGIFWGMVFLNPIHHLLFGGEKQKILGLFHGSKPPFRLKTCSFLAICFTSSSVFYLGNLSPLRKTTSTSLLYTWKLMVGRCLFFWGEGWPIFRGELLVSRRVPPRKLTWNLRITLVKRKNIFQTFMTLASMLNFGGVYMFYTIMIQTVPGGSTLKEKHDPRSPNSSIQMYPNVPSLFEQTISWLVGGFNPFENF